MPELKKYFWPKKSFLPDRESNPGLPRDRRRSSPLDYRGLLVRQETESSVHTCTRREGSRTKTSSFEPDLNQRPMDFCLKPTTVHRSTNWAIEGDTSKEGPVLYKFTWLDKGNSTALLTFRPVTKLSTTSWEGVTQVIRGANRSHTDITGA